MIIPRAVDYLSTLPSSFFPSSGNDTLTITCAPGPCAPPNRSDGSSAAQCLAVFTSLESGISQSIKYCASLTPDASAADKGIFEDFAGWFKATLRFLVLTIAIALAVLTIVAALLFIIFVVSRLARRFGPASWFEDSAKPAGEATPAAASTGQQADAGASAVEMSSLPVEGENGHREANGEDDAAENGSQTTDDATQWDDSEDAHLLVDKSKVDAA